MLNLININKSYGNVKIIDSLNLEIPDNRNVVFFGPNGCGKSTLLKIIAGLETYENGEIKNTKKENSEPIKTGLIFQDFRASLLPWKTVRDNINFVIGLNYKNRKERNQKTEAIITKLGLKPYQYKFPYQISGGIAQLTALGRAWALEPDVFLLDEPFSALDYQTSTRLQLQFLQLLHDVNKQAIIVTHSVEESILLSNKIVIFSASPMKIIEEIENPLPHPRQIEQLGSETAQQLRQRIIARTKEFVI